MSYHAQSTLRIINVRKTYTAPQYHSSCSLLSHSQCTQCTPWERSSDPRLWSDIWGLLWPSTTQDTGRERTDVSPWPWHRRVSPVYDSDPPCSLFHCVGSGPCLHRKLCVSLRCGQEPCKALPTTDKQCLVWIKRKNKALRIMEAEEENAQDSKMRAKEEYCFEPLT